jgi:hypothetical protein
MPDDTGDITDEERDQLTDPLQPADDIYNPALDQGKLDQDYESPAAPAPDSKQGTQLPPDHPEFDHDKEYDRTEVYDEGNLSATDIDAHEEVTPSETVLPLEPADNDSDGKAQ